MAVVAIVAVDNNDGDGFWQNGVWVMTPVLTGGQWRWLAELRRGGKLIKRRTVHRIHGV